MTERRLLLTAAVSIALHLLAALAFALLPRASAPWVEPSRPTASVELVMEERKGDARPDVPPPPPAPARPDAPPPPPPSPAVEPPAAKPPAAEFVPPPPEPAPEPAPEPSVLEQPRPEQPRPEQARTEQPPPEQPRPERPLDTPPPQPRPNPAPEKPAPPTISLRGTDSPSDAIAQGDHIVPASPDAVFHNRPPEYPLEAARLGQGGEVFLTIHISPGGKTAAVDVTRSSGYILLDRAAREAVLRWRFLPAVKDGQPVESAMTIRFVFDNK